MKTMRLSKMLAILFMISLFIMIGGCDKANESDIVPITLSYESNVLFNNESRHYPMSPFSGVTTPLYIKGGDGHYTVNNTNKDVITVDYNGKTIQFKPVSLGKSVIEIMDHSGNRYDLTVEVRYNEYNYVVASKYCIVKGDKITVGDKNELEDKVKSLYNVERYEFTYKNKANTKGTVRLYPQKAGEDYKEYDFENEPMKIVTDQNIRIMARVTMKTGNEQIVLYVTEFFEQTKSVGGGHLENVRYCFVKDLTERYTTEYPAMENVYEIQSVYSQKVSLAM